MYDQANSLFGSHLVYNIFVGGGPGLWASNKRSSKGVKKKESITLSISPTFPDPSCFASPAIVGRLLKELISRPQRLELVFVERDDMAVKRRSLIG